MTDPASDHRLPPPARAYEPRSSGHAGGEAFRAAVGQRDRPPGPPPSPDDQTPQDKLTPRTVAVGIGLALVAILIIQFFVVLAIGTDPSDYDTVLAGLISTIPVDIAVLIGVPFYLLGGKRNVWPALGFRRPGLPTVGWALAGLFLAYAIIGIYLGVVDLIESDTLEPVSTIDDDVIYDNVLLVVLVSIVAIGVAPISEEVFYRSFIFGGIRGRWGFVIAGLVSGLLFAATHFDVGSLIPFTGIGLAFAWVYHRSRNIGAAIGAHLLFNAIAVAGTLADRGVG